MTANKLTPLHVLLFIATIATTLLAGAVQNEPNGLAEPLKALLSVIKEPQKILSGIPFALSLLIILLAHELAHYFTSKRHAIPATLPYFIPAPNIIGTFGAIIKMKPPVMDRRSLIDIGASGPLSGFLISIIAVIVGLNFSEPAGEELSKGEFVLGPSFIFYFLVKLILGPGSFPVSLHPVAFAGWVGLLITSLNLFPIGQLDGGHIAYALFGERHRWVSISMIPLLFLLGLIFWPGWLMWALLMFILGLEHPPVVHPEIPLDRKRRLIGYLALAVFILTFAPIPFGEI